jgi:hypothetical protein
MALDTGNLVMEQLLIVLQDIADQMREINSTLEQILDKIGE